MSRLSVILVLTAFAVNAATFYVAPNGAEDASCLSPSDAGTLKAAYALASDAASAAEGDEIVLLAGEYDGTSAGGHLPLTITKKYLTIRSYEGTPNNTVFVGGGSAGGSLSAFTTSLVEGGPTIRYLTFTNFYQSSNYAAILNATVLGDASAVGCVFRNNYGKYGIVRFASAVASRFVGNTGASAAAVMQGSADGCYFENSSSSSFGSCYACTRIDSCTFTNNVGTAPVVYGSSIDGLVVSNCLFVGNQGGKYGGAIRFATVYDSVFVTNCAVSGAAIYQGNVYRCYFTNNATTSLGGATYAASCYDSIFSSNIGSSGGASYGGDYFINCYYTNNIGSSGSGGAIWTSASAIVSNCYFIANRCTKNGGAIYSAKSIYDSVFITNGATESGAVYQGGECYRCYFTNNYCSTGRNGGATGGTSCYDSIFSSNRGGSGGGSYEGAYFINCYYTNNIGSGGSGGAIWTSGAAIISNCYFVGNSCSSYGGATYKGSVYDSTYITNTGRYGGGTYAGSIDRCYLWGNVGTSYAGGTHGTASRNSTYIGNYSPSGGGADKGTFYNCYFRDNRSTSGGAIVIAAPAYLTNNVFINNSANNGGAVCTASGAYVVNCSFIGNRGKQSASIIGGAYAPAGWKGTFINCLMAENSSDSHPAMYGRLVTGDGVFINCTIVSNQCRATGKQWAPASGVFTNTLFHGNAYYDIESGELANCLYGAANMAEVTTNEACIVLADPLFNYKKNLDHPFYLHKSSPAIDAGIIVPELLCTNIVDLGGTRRIKGRAVDIGAYETLGPGTLFGVY